MKTTVWQKHHIVYNSEKNKEVVRKIRKGVHQIVCLIHRYKHLTSEEINTIIIECELKRNFKGKENE